MEYKYTEVSSENTDELKIIEAIFNEVYGMYSKIQHIDFLEQLDEAGFAICMKKSED